VTGRLAHARSVRKTPPNVRFAFLIYDGFTALDLIGPYEVFSGWPDAELHYVAKSHDPVRTDRGLRVLPTDTTKSLEEADLVLVPGAGNPLKPLEDEELLRWARAVAEHATWMTSVCTGAGIYAAAGLLNGRRATTHWAVREHLASMGVDVSTDRVVIDRPFASAAGVSAGIDLALSLTAEVHGEELARQLQLAIEYDPEPPFDSGSPETASDELKMATLQILARNAAEA
jgi:transcriptional regulator GlxA family with amidase domain